MSERSMDLLFLGMLSRFDTIMGEPMEDVLAGVSLAEDVVEALIDPDGTGPLSIVLRLVRAYERADWDAVAATVSDLSVDEDLLPALYLDAIEWSEALFRKRF